MFSLFPLLCGLVEFSFAKAHITHVYDLFVAFAQYIVGVFEEPIRDETDFFLRMIESNRRTNIT